MKIISEIEKKLFINFEIDEIIGINTVKKLIELTKKKVMYCHQYIRYFQKILKKNQIKFLFIASMNLLTDIIVKKKLIF